MDPFLGKQGQHGSRESYILPKKIVPTHSLVTMALQRSSLAVCEFRTASEECCRQGYDQCVQTLLPDVVAPETQQNSLRELKLNFRVTTQEFCMVDGYTEDLTNHKTVKI